MVPQICYECGENNGCVDQGEGRIIILGKRKRKQKKRKEKWMKGLRN
jgi:hypothetical protein